MSGIAKIRIVIRKRQSELTPFLRVTQHLPHCGDRIGKGIGIKKYADLSLLLLIYLLPIILRLNTIKSQKWRWPGQLSSQIQPITRLGERQRKNLKEGLWWWQTENQKHMWNRGCMFASSINSRTHKLVIVYNCVQLINHILCTISYLLDLIIFYMLSVAIFLLWFLIVDYCQGNYCKIHISLLF